MIKQLPGEYEVVDMRYFRKKFSCPTTQSFDELRGAVVELIDQTNAQYEAIQRIIGRQHRHLSDDHKKPRSTNIELRQKIAVLELNNHVLQQKCEDYLGKLTEAKQALDWIGNNRLAENPVRVEQLRRHARNALEEINRKQD